jgi:pimeloyl-ACP methyl ester carboxylesterase
VSWSLYAWIFGWALLAAAGVWRGRRRGLALSALAVFAVIVGVRSFSAAEGRRMRMVNSDGGGARWLGRIVDEGDLAVVGALLLSWTHLLHDPEAALVPASLRRAYGELREAEGDAPSPVVPTYVGLETARHADVVVIEPEETPRGALIFLHGFAGNFALPCWLMAQAAPDLVTYCPSVGWRGDWWSANGVRTLEMTLALAHRRGFERVYLAGLSNGAAGAARAAPRLHGALRGLILLSGASRDAPPPGVPVLVVQGRRDQMSGAELARSYAARSGGQYLELEGGHFAFLLRREQALPAIREWLRHH